MVVCLYKNRLELLAACKSEVTHLRSMHVNSHDSELPAPVACGPEASRCNECKRGRQVSKQSTVSAQQPGLLLCSQQVGSCQGIDNRTMTDSPQVDVNDYGVREVLSVA